MCTWRHSSTAPPDGRYAEAVVDLLHDPTDTSNRTFLFATPANGMVEIVRTTPAVIHMGGKAATAAQPR